MARHLTFLTALLLATWALPAWNQEQSLRGCDSDSAEEKVVAHSERTHVTWIRDAEGKMRPVFSPVKELKVVRLIFVGTPTLSAALQYEIAKSVSERDYNDDKEGVEEVLQRVQDEWQHYGYFKVKVEHSGTQTLGEDADARTVAITVKVDAGKQYRLTEILFGNMPSWPRPTPLASDPPEEPRQFTDDQLRAFFAIQQGEIFDTHKIQLGLEELRKAYATRGFINTVNNPTTKFDEDSNNVTLLVQFEEGEQFRYGKVEVRGMDPLAANKLLRSAGLVPGRVFNFSHLEEFTKRIALLFPNDFKPEEDTERRLDEKARTVDLILRVHACDAP